MGKILKEDLASQTTNKETNLSDILSGGLEDRWNPEPDWSNSNSLNSNLALACTMLKLGLRSKNCQLQSSHGASKNKLAKTGFLPGDGFSLHIRDKPKEPSGWWQLSKTGYNVAGPWRTELRLRWSTGHTGRPGICMELKRKSWLDGHQELAGRWVGSGRVLVPVETSSRNPKPSLWTLRTNGNITSNRSQPDLIRCQEEERRRQQAERGTEELQG